MIRYLYIIPFLVLALSALAAGVTLQWSDNDPTVTGYDVYYGEASGAYTAVLDVGDTTNATITGLADETTYYFAVTAYNSNGVQSAYSPQVHYRTRPAVPEPLPTNYVTFATADGAFHLTLENPPGTLFAVVRSNGAVQFGHSPWGPWETIDVLPSWQPMTITIQTNL